MNPVTVPTNATYKTSSAHPSQSLTWLSIVQKMHVNDATIKNGIPIVIASDDTSRGTTKLGMPVTSNALNVFEPNALPIAIE